MPRLRVRLVNAVDLLGADFDGFSDPYCVLTIENNSQQSQTIKHSLNPTWNEIFEFEIANVQAHTSLNVHVVDYDAVGADDSLGESNIMVKDLITGMEKIFWVKLEGGEMGENIVGKALGSFFGKGKSKSKQKSSTEAKLVNKGRVQIGLTALDFSGHASGGIVPVQVTRSKSGTILQSTPTAKPRKSASKKFISRS